MSNNVYFTYTYMFFQSQIHRQKRPAAQTHITDPKRELTESLPLCLGNEDYLKDFQPLPSKHYIYLFC